MDPFGRGRKAKLLQRVSVNQSEEAQHRGLIDERRLAPLCPEGQRPHPPSAASLPHSAQVKWNEVAQVFKLNCLNRLSARDTAVRVAVATVTGNQALPLRELLMGTVLVVPDEKPLGRLSVSF